MSPSKREREYARRRYEHYQTRVVAKRTKRQQQRRAALAAFVVLGVLLVTGLTAALLDSRNADDAASADTSTAADEASGSETPATDEPSQAYSLPDPSFAEARMWTGEIVTDQGTIGIELDGAAAPQAVASFVSLAQQGYFDGTPCHRLVVGGIKVLQCGSPTGDPSAGPGYSFGPVENAPADDVYPAGTIAMARVQGDAESMGSQFFLVYEDSTIPADAAGGYSIFGRMTSGLDVVTAVADAGVQGGGTDGPPVTGVTIQGVETQ